MPKVGKESKKVGAVARETVETSKCGEDICVCGVRWRKMGGVGRPRAKRAGAGWGEWEAKSGEEGRESTRRAVKEISREVKWSKK